MPEKYVPRYRAPKRSGFGRSGDKNPFGRSDNGEFKLSRKKEPSEAPPAHSSHVRETEAPLKPAAAPARDDAAPVPSPSAHRVEPDSARSGIEDLFAPESFEQPSPTRATEDQYDSLVAGRSPVSGSDPRPGPAPIKASPVPAESLRPSRSDDEPHPESGSTMVDALEGTKVRSAIKGGGEAWDPFLKDPEPSHRRFSRNGGMSDLDKLTTSKLKPKKRRKTEKADRPATSHERQQHQTLGQWFREILILGLVAILTAVLLTNYVVQAFFIPSESMEGTLVVNDRVLVNKLAYNFGEPEPGDIIVFTSPERNAAAEATSGPLGDVLNEVAQGLGLRSSVQDLIKRVIAVEGQTIEVKIGSVFVDGEQIDEPYRKDFLPMPDFPPTEVPEGAVFVMGDNRFQSLDSRGFGPVAKDTIVGRAFALIWPVTRFNWLRSSTG